MASTLPRSGMSWTGESNLSFSLVGGRAVTLHAAMSVILST